MKTQLHLPKKTPLPPKLKVNRPSRVKPIFSGSQALKGIEYALPELRQLFSKRWNEYRSLCRSTIRRHGHEIVLAIRFHRGQPNDPTDRRSAMTAKWNTTFARLRQLNDGLNTATQQATGLYRELAAECRSLLATGVDKSTLTRELIAAGRTASRASELLSVATLTAAHFDHFLSGEIAWRLALTTSRASPEFLQAWEALADPAQASSLHIPPASPVLHEAPAPLTHQERQDLRDAAAHDDEADFQLIPADPQPEDPIQPELPQLLPPPKQVGSQLSVGELRAVNLAKLRLELVKIAKLSRKSFIEQTRVEEIGGYRITIEPLAQ